MKTYESISGALEYTILCYLFVGHVNLQATFELYMNNQTEVSAPSDAIMMYLSSVQEAVKQGKIHDPTYLISNNLESQVGVASRVIVLSQGVRVIIRSPNRAGIDVLWTKYSNGSIKQLLHSALWIQNIGQKCGITNMKLSAELDKSQLIQYTTIFQEAQGIIMFYINTSYGSR